MKKFLLSLAALACMGTYAHAEGTTLVMKEFYNISATAPAPETQTSGSYTVTVKKNAGTTAPACNKSGDLRLYAKNTITIASSDADITSLSFELSAQGKKQYAAITASTGTVGAQAQGDDALTWTGNAKEVTFTVGDGNDYGTATDKKAGQFDINSIAINGGGAVAPVETVKVANIAAFLASADATATYEFTSPVNVVYQCNYTSASGNLTCNLFVEDATGGMFIYGDTKQTYQKGDVIPAGFTGKYMNYSGCIEFVAESNFQAASGTATVEPAEWALEDISMDQQNLYVIVKNCAVKADAAGTGLVMEQDGTELTIYDKFGINLAEGENLNITGIVAVYSNKLQFYPIVITDGTGAVVEAVAAPKFSVAAGAVEAGSTVALSCATEGASIYYTLDGTEPTASSTLYTEPIVINEAVTIKAIAVKEGLTNSTVASASYTIKGEEPVIEGVTFDFSAPATLTPAYNAEVPGDATADENNGAVQGYYFLVSDVEFTNGGVTVVTTKGNSTDARLYYSNSASMWSYRAYKGGTTTISVSGDDDITGLKVVGNNVTRLVSSDITWEGTGKESTWTGNGVKSITFNIDGGTATINQLVVMLSSGAGVDGVVAEGAEAPVEYFNLQGVRVANPENGLYIRRQGNKVEKVVIR